MRNEHYIILFSVCYVRRMTSLKEELMHSNSDNTEKTAKFVEIKSNLMNWIHNVEGLLLSEYPTINSIPIMEAQLKHFKVYIHNRWSARRLPVDASSHFAITVVILI